MKRCLITVVASPLPVVVALLIGIGGCATQGERMVESFAKTRKTVGEAQSQLDATLLSLHGLRALPVSQLSEGFRRYEKSVADLEVESNQANLRAETMQSEADAHVKAWQKEMADITDADIKASMESRREAVRSNYKLVKMYAQDARKAYGPYVAANKQLVKALSIDLSPAAIASLSPSIDRVLLDGAALKERLAAMQYALNNIANGVSPIDTMD